MNLSRFVHHISLDFEPSTGSVKACWPPPKANDKALPSWQCSAVCHQYDQEVQGQGEPVLTWVLPNRAFTQLENCAPNYTPKYIHFTNTALQHSPSTAINSLLSSCCFMKLLLRLIRHRWLITFHMQSKNSFWEEKSLQESRPHFHFSTGGQKPLSIQFQASNPTTRLIPPEEHLQPHTREECAHHL